MSIQVVLKQPLLCVEMYDEGPSVGPPDDRSPTVLVVYFMNTGTIADAEFILAEDQPAFIEFYKDRYRHYSNGPIRFFSNVQNCFYGRCFSSLDALNKEFASWLYEGTRFSDTALTFGDMTLESKKSLQALAGNLVRCLLDDENISMDRVISSHDVEYRDMAFWDAMSRDPEYQEINERISDLEEIHRLLRDLYGSTWGRFL